MSFSSSSFWFAFSDQGPLHFTSEQNLGHAHSSLPVNGSWSLHIPISCATLITTVWFKGGMGQPLLKYHSTTVCQWWGEGASLKHFRSDTVWRTAGPPPRNDLLTKPQFPLRLLRFPLLWVLLICSWGRSKRRSSPEIEGLMWLEFQWVGH